MKSDIKSIKVLEHLPNTKCSKCNYKWLSRVAKPKSCPQCKTRIWDRKKATA